MSRTTMRLAMIGSYGHVGFVLNSPALGNRVELVAAGRFGPDDRLGFVDDHPAAKGIAVYDDYHEMLREVKPDIVSVCMPLYRNAEGAIAAAEAGCHVFCEKPLATTHEDLGRLRDVVRSQSVRISAMFGMRAEPGFQTVRNIVTDGGIGEVVFAFGQKSYPFNQRDGYYKQRETYGGSILWQAIHALEFVAYCTGQRYTHVSAMQSNAAHPTHPGMEDNGGLLLGLSGGGHAVISFDYLRPWPGDGKRRWGDDRLRVVGTEGQVELSSDPPGVRWMTTSRDEMLPLPESGVDLLGNFVESIRSDAPVLVPDAEALGITEVALRARGAADEGCVVPLPGY